MARQKPLRSHPVQPPYVPGLTQPYQITLAAVKQYESDLDIAFSQLTGLPTTLAGYGVTDAYTDAEVDALLTGYALVGHDHDADYAPLVHTHDDRYYTEAEVDALIADFLTEADADLLYSPLGHTHAAPALDDVSDVVLTAPADGDALTYDLASGTWVNTPLGGGGPHTLDSHTDVDTTGVTTGDVLTYDGADWVPQAPAAAGVDGTGSAGAFPIWQDSNTLEDSPLFMMSNGPGHFTDTDLIKWSFAPGVVTPGNGPSNPGWEFNFDPADGSFALATTNTGIDAIYANTAGEVKVNKRLYFDMGSDTTGRAWIGRAATDNIQIRTNDDGADAQIDATKPSWAVVTHEGVADNFTIYRRAPGGSFTEFFKVTAAGHIQVQQTAMYSPNVSDSFTFDGDTIPHYGFTFFPDSRSGFVAFALAGYGGFSIFTQGAERIRITQGGTVLFSNGIFAVTDNNSDIGSSGANRFRTAYLGTSIVVPTVNATTQVQINGSKVLGARGAAIANTTTNTTTLMNTVNAILARMRVTGGHGLISD